jgi:hypothetical protein
MSDTTATALNQKKSKKAEKEEKEVCSICADTYTAVVRRKVV